MRLHSFLIIYIFMGFAHNMKLNICLFEDLLARTKKNHECISLLKGREVDFSWHISTWNFQNKCQLQHAFKNLTELFWTRAKNVHIAQGGLGHRSPFPTPCAAACIPSHVPGEQSHSCMLSHPHCGCIQAWHLHRKFKTSGSQVLLYMQCF